MYVSVTLDDPDLVLGSVAFFPGRRTKERQYTSIDGTYNGGNLATGEAKRIVFLTHRTTPFTPPSSPLLSVSLWRGGELFLTTRRPVLLSMEWTIDERKPVSMRGVDLTIIHCYPLELDLHSVVDEHCVETH